MISKINAMMRALIELRESGQAAITLLAVCPNSDAVLEAAVKVAAANHTPMLFAATLNQVDRDGGYTGWTPASFVARMNEYGAAYGCRAPLLPCLDHGGQWLKDAHTRDRLSLDETTAEVKATLTACLEAGYALLHVDPTVDRTLPPGQPPALETVVARTLDLIAHAEAERTRLGLPPVAYEVGTEEVHGGLVDVGAFARFVDLLRAGLEDAGLLHAWPAFVVAQVGTDLHTTWFDPEAARRLHGLVAPTGALLKGHYTDWVGNPADYPATGMGGANVGPEFTAEEYLALRDLEAKEAALLHARAGVQAAGLSAALEQAVLDSGRWRKWLQPEEAGLEFNALSSERRAWLVQTGARYIWANPAVQAARAALYANLAEVMAAPHAYVVDRIAAAIDRYVNAFGLFDAATALQ
jgi:tagatose-1,6-bisphosphate aldolase non-catalytic subunit AgaZ/GatZ